MFVFNVSVYRVIRTRADKCDLNRPTLPSAFPFTSVPFTSVAFPFPSANRAINYYLEVCCVMCPGEIDCTEGHFSWLTDCEWIHNVTWSYLVALTTYTFCLYFCELAWLMQESLFWFSERHCIDNNDCSGVIMKTCAICPDCKLTK